MADVTPIHCSARGDVMLDHCWHHTHTLTCDPPIPMERCCWCGTTRNQPRMVFSFQAHGPYNQ